MSFWENFPSNRLLVDVSLWSADFTRLGEEIIRLDPYADLYHIDVSDAHFVPGLLLFPDLVAALRPLTHRPFHVHLMTDNPLPHIAEFATAGADLITIHLENGPRIPAALSAIHELGLASGLALGLDAPLEAVLPFLDQIDILILMGTPLGVKGLEPSQNAYHRVERMRELLNTPGASSGQVKIAADGGIRTHTVPALRRSGADLVVAGSLAFKSHDISQTFQWLHSLP